MASKTKQRMDAIALARMLTRKALGILFFLVFFLSMLFGPGDGAALVSSLVKALLAVVLGWIFLLIVTDAVVRSIAASAVESRAAREDGGLLAHFLPSESGETGDGKK